MRDMHGLGRMADRTARGDTGTGADGAHRGTRSDRQAPTNLMRTTGHAGRRRAAWLAPIAASAVALGLALAPAPAATAQAPQAPMYRLYNRWSGEHLFTEDAGEYASLGTIGWAQEGEAWESPTGSGDPIYRLYNPYSGDHLYTGDAAEYESLGALGWRREGVAFYASDRDAGWDETVVDTPAWDETVVDREAWDEQVVDTPAWDELVKEKTKDPRYTYLDYQIGETTVHTSDGKVFPIDGEWSRYLIDHPGVTATFVSDIYYARYVHHDATYRTVHHEAETHVVHHDAVTHTVHHDAVTHVEHHDATYGTVHHEAETHVVHHDAVTHTVHHDATYGTVHHGA